jgi:predicted  nucleic acid-binding Zn-ribbon protein
MTKKRVIIMNKTRVDDMLIEMISPKIKEIEEKFSAGKGLNQEDINTLLLKSQYNHINHLDDKLNEVTSSVLALENKFVSLENKFVSLENKFDLLNEKIEHTIQKALNKNMMLLVSVMGFFLIISKLIDKM